ncbi:MAG TPA: hypothetical protein VGZ02_17260 [Candidatus Baltobacteraceae bacterium]|jgi:hypothetical protein|nr:hypothetical protein [Candidatus Baltobacteraceae bacterium]
MRRSQLVGWHRTDMRLDLTLKNLVVSFQRFRAAPVRSPVVDIPLDDSPTVTFSG